MLIRPALAALILSAAVTAASAQNAEDNLIGVLQSDAPPAEKDAACKQLKLVGDAASVPALAALLNDETLAFPARDALESMPCPEAGKALLDAFSTTTGPNRAGVIESLGIRREQPAVPALIALLANADATTAAAAARALGRIGTEEVVEPLMRAVKSGDVAAADALLRAFNQLPPTRVFHLASELYSLDLPEHIRIAAYRAQILAGDEPGTNALDLTLAGITGADRPARVAALGVAAQLPGTEATRALADALAKVDPPVQAALVRALGDRADKAALPAAARAAENNDPEVRLAAFRALGQLGDASTVPLLARLAANATDAERDAARQALAALRGEGVCDAMTRLLQQAPAPEQAELFKALAARKEPAAAPALLQIARAQDQPTAAAAIKALGALAADPDVMPLIALMNEASSNAVREAAEDAIVKIAARSANPAGIVDALLAAHPAGAQQYLAALTAAAWIDFPLALPRLQDAIKSADAVLRPGAVRVFAQFCGPESMTQLLDLAAHAPDETESTLIMRGYWRAFDQVKDATPEDRLEMVRAGLAAAKNAESKKGGVAALADIPLTGALETAQQACADQAVRPEAELAAYTVATCLVFAEPAAAQAALQTLAQSALDEKLREKATSALRNVTGETGFVVPWLVSEPYRVEGKQGPDLFDMTFPPEQTGDAAWNLQPPAADPQSLWYIDLGPAVAGDHCVIYLKTRVFSEAGGATTAEIGSDDGIELWVNSELVHANNAVRGFAPGQDKAEIALKPGWNDLLAKITQHTAGCAMAVRLPNLQFRVEPK